MSSMDPAGFDPASVEPEPDLGQQRDKALAKAAVAAIISRGVTSMTVVASIALAANALTSDELGVVAVLTTLVVFLGFGDFGLGTLLMTRLPAARARGDVDQERALVGGVLSTLCVIGCGLGALGVATALFLPWQTLLGAEAIDEDAVRRAVAIFFVAGGLSIPAGLGGRILAALQRSHVTHTWNMAAGIVALVCTGVVAGLDLPLWTYVAALAGPTAVLGFVQTIWVLTRTYPELMPERARIPFRQAVELLKSGLLYATMSVSAVVSFYIDSLVVSSVLGASDAAVFAVAARLFALIGGTLNLAGQQLWSALADAFARHDYEWARKRFRHTMVISVSINLVGCAFLVAAGPWLARVWVGEDLVPPRSLLITLALWTVYSTALFQSAYVLAAVERIRALAIAGVISAVLNVGASIGLTEWLGLAGPSLGSIAAVTVTMTPVVVILTRRELRRSPET